MHSHSDHQTAVPHSESCRKREWQMLKYEPVQDRHSTGHSPPREQSASTPSDHLPTTALSLPDPLDHRRVRSLFTSISRSLLIC